MKIKTVKPKPADKPPDFLAELDRLYRERWSRVPPESKKRLLAAMKKGDPNPVRVKFVTDPERYA